MAVLGREPDAWPSPGQGSVLAVRFERPGGTFYTGPRPPQAKKHPALKPDQRRRRFGISRAEKNRQKPRLKRHGFSAEAVENLAIP